MYHANKEEWKGVVGWEEEFEDTSPLAFSGRKWAKDFIRKQITTAKAQEREAILRELPKRGTNEPFATETNKYMSGWNDYESEVRTIITKRNQA